MALKIPVSFAEDEVHIYNYIKSKRNYSVYIKDLVEEDMKKNSTNNNKLEFSNQKRSESDLGFEF